MLYTREVASHSSFPANVPHYVVSLPNTLYQYGIEIRTRSNCKPSHDIVNLVPQFTIYKIN